jgi:hypothetical protein
VKRAYIGLAVGAAGVVVFVACSFPSIGYLDASGGGGAVAQGSSTSGGGRSTATSTTSTSSSSGTGGAGTGGAGTGGGMDAGTDAGMDAGFPCVDPTNPCDCDGDGDNAATEECDFDGGDCNDHDPLVNSKQTMWFTTPGSNGWDYNCDGKDEYEYTDPLSCGFANCDTSTQKWTGSAPDCGQAGPYATCSGNVIICNDGPVLGMRTQGCH